MKSYSTRDHDAYDYRWQDKMYLTITGDRLYPLAEGHRSSEWSDGVLHPAPEATWVGDYWTGYWVYTRKEN